MDDREKVIKGLKCCVKWMKECDEDACKSCPYYSCSDCIATVNIDAIALLKEQEPVKPTYEDFFGNRIARCGKCNGYIVRYKYCPGCGREVKWE